jgi:hypothetical protein
VQLDHLLWRSASRAPDSVQAAQSSGVDKSREDGVVSRQLSEISESTVLSPSSKPCRGVIPCHICVAASFVFGLVNHFLRPGADHVRHAAEQARLLFTATAVLLALTEAVGPFLAVRLLRHRMGVEM